MNSTSELLDYLQLSFLGIYEMAQNTTTALVDQSHEMISLASQIQLLHESIQSRLTDLDTGFERLAKALDYTEERILSWNGSNNIWIFGCGGLILGLLLSNYRWLIIGKSKTADWLTAVTCFSLMSVRGLSFAPQSVVSAGFLCLLGCIVGIILARRWRRRKISSVSTDLQLAGQMAPHTYLNLNRDLNYYMDA